MYITCYASFNRVSKVFNWISKNNFPNEQDFYKVKLHTAVFDNESGRILEDIFGDVTFEEFEGFLINKISPNVFNKTINKMRQFKCHKCPLDNDVYKIINQMDANLNLELYVTEIPSNAFGLNSTLTSVTFKSYQNLTIKSGAFQLNQLDIHFYQTTINKIEKKAFILLNKEIEFNDCILSGK